MPKNQEIGLVLAKSIPGEPLFTRPLVDQIAEQLGATRLDASGGWWGRRWDLQLPVRERLLSLYQRLGPNLLNSLSIVERPDDVYRIIGISTITSYRGRSFTDVHFTVDDPSHLILLRIRNNGRYLSVIGPKVEGSLLIEYNISHE